MGWDQWRCWLVWHLQPREWLKIQTTVAQLTSHVLSSENQHCLLPWSGHCFLLVTSIRHLSQRCESECIFFDSLWQTARRGCYLISICKCEPRSTNISGTHMSLTNMRPVIKFGLCSSVKILQNSSGSSPWSIRTSEQARAKSNKEQHEDATFVIRVRRTALSTEHQRFRIHMRHDLELITAYEKCTGGRPGFFRNACSVLSQVSQLNYLLAHRWMLRLRGQIHQLHWGLLFWYCLFFPSSQQVGEYQWFSLTKRAMIFNESCQSKFVSPILNHASSKFSGIILLQFLMRAISYHI